MARFPGHRPWSSEPGTTTSTLAALAVLVLAVVRFAAATELQVGGTGQWDFGAYQGWANTTRFVVGDQILFLYERGDHDVITLSQADFASCTVSSYTARYETGNDTVTLDKPGPAYFSCSLPGHCPDMKFFINVLPAPTLPPGGNNAGQTPPPPSAATLSRSVTHPLEFALLAAATAAVLGLQLL